MLEAAVVVQRINGDSTDYSPDVLRSSTPMQMQDFEMELEQEQRYIYPTEFSDNDEEVRDLPIRVTRSSSRLREPQFSDDYEIELAQQQMDPTEFSDNDKKIITPKKVKAVEKMGIRRRPRIKKNTMKLPAVVDQEEHGEESSLNY